MLKLAAVQPQQLDCYSVCNDQNLRSPQRRSQLAKPPRADAARSRKDLFCDAAIGIRFADKAGECLLHLQAITHHNAAQRRMTT